MATALASDQHRDVLPGDAPDRLVDLAHGRAGAEDRTVDVGVGRRPRDHRRRAHDARHVQGFSRHPSQLIEVERFEQVVERSPLHRLDGVVGRFGHGHEDDRDARIQ
jgi:hypothetical protein